MATLNTTNIKHASSSTNNIVLNADGSTTIPNLSVGPNRNLIINGGMQVAQRGVSATGLAANGYATVDRFSATQSGTDDYIEQHQVDVSSGTTPYTEGFRKAFQIKNGNQTSGAGSADYVHAVYAVEDQDLAISGWNYTSASSYITFSFWIKSSVAQNFYLYLQSDNGSQYRYVMETGSLSADTWTKVTKTIPGNSNLVFNNDTGVGMYIVWNIFDGTDRTGTRPLNAWAALDNANRTPDQTSTWYTTNDATFEVTGVQLEVGSVATDFEHRHLTDEYLRCLRYCNVLGSAAFGTNDQNYERLMDGMNYNSTTSRFLYLHPVPMRGRATVSTPDASHLSCSKTDAGGAVSSLSRLDNTSSNMGTGIEASHSSAGFGAGSLIFLEKNNNVNGRIILDSEL